MNLFKRPRKVKFPAPIAYDWYANGNFIGTTKPGQTPPMLDATYVSHIEPRRVPSDVPTDVPDVSTWPGIRDQQAADYLNAIPDVDDEQWDPMPPPTTTHMEVWDLERALKQKMANESVPTMWIPVIQHRPEYPPKDDQHGWDPLFPPETLALFERVRAYNIREHGTPRARVVKRDGYWISIVYGSDGAAVLYDEVFATTRERGIHNGWQEMMTAADEDMATVRRIEAAGHRLPEAENPTHY